MNSDRNIETNVILLYCISVADAERDGWRAPETLFLHGPRQVPPCCTADADAIYLGL